MRTVYDPVELIQRALDQWDIPYVEQDIIDTSDTRRIAATVNAFCEKHNLLLTDGESLLAEAG